MIIYIEILRFVDLLLNESLKVEYIILFKKIKLKRKKEKETN